MTDTDSPPSSWFTNDDEDGSGEQAELAASAEQALASIAQRYEQATAALQALLDQHVPQASADEGHALEQPGPEPGSHGS